MTVEWQEKVHIDTDGYKTHLNLFCYGADICLEMAYACHVLYVIRNVFALLLLLRVYCVLDEHKLFSFFLD